MESRRPPVAACVSTWTPTAPPRYSRRLPFLKPRPKCFRTEINRANQPRGLKPEVSKLTTEGTERNQKKLRCSVFSVLLRALRG
jgi:hypothetical protein